MLTRPEHLPPGANAEMALGFTRYLASIAHLQEIHFLWRPLLRNPDDDMVLECAIASGANTIVTHNLKNFVRARALGVQAKTQGQFLKKSEREMTMTALTVRLPNSVHETIKDLAKRDGVSVNQFIASAAAGKMASFLTVEHLKREAAKGTRKDFEKFLRKVPSVPPLPGDERE